CALHTFERRFDSRGEGLLLQVGARDKIVLDAQRSNDVALVLVREYSEHRVLLETELEIRSSHIKAALQATIKSYPGVYLDTSGPITLNDEPRCLFHYRKELQAYGASLSDAHAKQHIELCMNYMAKTLRKEIHTYERLMCHPEKAPGLEYSSLWMAYRPGDLVYARTWPNDLEIIFRLTSMIRKKPSTEWPAKSRDHWLLEGEQMVCIGSTFRCDTLFRVVYQYDGYRPLSELEAFPMIYHPEVSQMKERLLARGKKYVSLAGSPYCHYDGPASVFQKDYEGTGASQTRAICQRIMIGSGEFYTNKAPGSVQLTHTHHNMDLTADEDLDISDEQFILCHSQLPGFCLSSKEWAMFDVAKITDIDFNPTAFDSLVLDESKKSMISSLVRERVDQESTFDDIIKGKGKGLIFLLHGEPGTGKTLTAESIAEYTRRPLYTVGCGDLGIVSYQVERVLNASLTLATKWNAVVLLDEADVFMESRSSNEIQRNGLVSVLLRTLEYFEGIMFLTTKRIGTIDQAFKSRIHLSLSYPSLGPEARRHIWRNNLVRSFSGASIDWFNNKFLDEVIKEALNGRQIKNIVRVADAQAVHAKRDMIPEDIFRAVKALIDFEKDFSD
ncbi:P-loop containing nucleoside triphosphate hydrolase protein, partial [Byssothecium circinans]